MHVLHVQLGFNAMTWTLQLWHYEIPLVFMMEKNTLFLNVINDYMTCKV